MPAGAIATDDETIRILSLSLETIRARGAHLVCRARPH
jgi:hypothetical protein